MLFSEMGNPFTESGAQLGIDIPINDRGDLSLTAETMHQRVRASVAAAVAEGNVLMILGGDHSITFPVIEALAAVHGPIEILHIDAHPDLYNDFGGNPASHASPFARIMERGLAKRLVQVGVRTMNHHQREQAERFGVEVIEMSRFVLDDVPLPGSPLYVSIGLDGLDPAFAPGVSHHEPGGLSTREVLRMLRRLREPIIGADVVELNPSRDINEMTATVAAKLVKELCSLCQEG